jgi:hypothetical protein
MEIILHLVDARKRREESMKGLNAAMTSVVFVTRCGVVRNGKGVMSSQTSPANI